MGKSVFKKFDYTHIKKQDTLIFKQLNQQIISNHLGETKIIQWCAQ